jgi:hypothetical protein
MMVVDLPTMLDAGSDALVEQPTKTTAASAAHNPSL